MSSYPLLCVCCILVVLFDMGSMLLLGAACVMIAEGVYYRAFLLACLRGCLISKPSRQQTGSEVGLFCVAAAAACEDCRTLDWLSTLLSWGWLGLGAESLLMWYLYHWLSQSDAEFLSQKTPWGQASFNLVGSYALAQCHCTTHAPHVMYSH